MASGTYSIILLLIIIFIEQRTPSVSAIAPETGNTHAIYNPLPQLATPLQKAVLEIISNHPDPDAKQLVHLNGVQLGQISARARDLVAIGPRPPVMKARFITVRGKPH
ncbi:hypothetical protein AVEN_270077-1 [Araneus ventricosus]|uniref:Uncharacterized protein n=1 Tax=Araneus ventricosus TaxID=182803 RepID=A0A4Y2VL60_ARAVE|nr:hypothetical protein AVEN_270077-1 [Araneus ventricosus]